MPLTSRMLLTCHQSLKQTPSVLSESKNNVLNSFSLFPSLPCSVGSKNNIPIYRYGYKVCLLNKCLFYILKKGVD